MSPSKNFNSFLRKILKTKITLFCSTWQIISVFDRFIKLQDKKVKLKGNSIAFTDIKVIFECGKLFIFTGQWMPAYNLSNIDNTGFFFLSSFIPILFWSRVQTKASKFSTSTHKKSHETWLIVTLNLSQKCSWWVKGCVNRTQICSVNAFFRNH